MQPPGQVLQGIGGDHVALVQDNDVGLAQLCAADAGVFGRGGIFRIGRAAEIQRVGHGDDKAGGDDIAQIFQGVHDVGRVGQPCCFQHELLGGHGGDDAFKSRAQAVGQGTAHAAFVQGFHQRVALHERGVKLHVAEFVLDDAGIAFAAVQKVQPAAQKGGLARAEKAREHMKHGEGTIVRIFRPVPRRHGAQRVQGFAVQGLRRPEGGRDVENGLPFSRAFPKRAVTVKAQSGRGRRAAGNGGVFPEFLFRRAHQHGEEAKKKAEGGDIAFRRAGRDQPAVPGGDAVGRHDTTPRRGFQSEGQRVAGKGGVQTQRAKTKRLKLRLIAGKVAHRFVIRRGEGETQGRQGKHIQQGRFRLGENKQAEGAAEAERRAGGALLLAVKADAENMVATGHAACPGRVRGSGRTHSAPAERSGAGAFKMCGHDQ